MVYLNNISYLEEYLNKYPDAYVDLESMCPRDPLPDCDRHHNEEKCRKCWFREVPRNSINGKALDEFNKIGNPNAVSQKDIHQVIKDSGDRTKFDTGAVRDMHEGKGRMDLLPWAAIMEVSKHCENGAKKYGEHNVDKGIPIHSLCDSAARHLAKYIDGWDDEPHLIAAAWNLLWAIQMELKHPELCDIPYDKTH